MNNVVCLLNDELSELTKNDGALRNGHFHTMYWCLFFKISRNTDVIVVAEDQKLFKDDQPLDDNKTLGDYGFTFATARAQAPATIGLACKQDDGEFEQLEITPLSSPPELPDVMKQQDSTSAHAQEQTAS